MATKKQIAAAKTKAEEKQIAAAKTKAEEKQALLGDAPVTEGPEMTATEVKARMGGVAEEGELPKDGKHTFPDDKGPDHVALTVKNIDIIAGDGMGAEALKHATREYEAAEEGLSFHDDLSEDDQVTVVVWSAIRLLAEMATKLGANDQPALVGVVDQARESLVRAERETNRLQSDNAKMAVTLDAQATEIIRLKANQGARTESLHGRIDDLKSG